MKTVGKSLVLIGDPGERVWYLGPATLHGSWSFRAVVLRCAPNGATSGSGAFGPRSTSRGRSCRTFDFLVSHSWFTLGGVMNPRRSNHSLGTSSVTTSTHFSTLVQTGGLAITWRSAEPGPSRDALKVPRLQMSCHKPPSPCQS